MRSEKRGTAYSAEARVHYLLPTSVERQRLVYFLPFENSRRQEVWRQQTANLSATVHARPDLNAATQQLIGNFKCLSCFAHVTPSLGGYATRWQIYTGHKSEIIGAGGFETQPTDNLSKKEVKLQGWDEEVRQLGNICFYATEQCLHSQLGSRSTNRNRRYAWDQPIPTS